MTGLLLAAIALWLYILNAWLPWSSLKVKYPVNIVAFVLLLIWIVVQLVAVVPIR